MGQETRPYAGYGALLKRGGSVAGGLSTVGASGGEQRNIFLTNVTPLNPTNNIYPPGINASSFPSVVVPGKLTPSVLLQACLKPYNAGTGKGWADAALFNSLINVDGTLNTDLFCFGIKDERSSGGFGAGLRLWDWSRCELLQFQSDAVGGPVMVTMGFRSRWGDIRSNAAFYGQTNATTGEVYPDAPSFTTPSGADAGQLSAVADIDFRSGTSSAGSASTLTDVKRWVLTLMRGQMFEFEYDRTKNPKDISSRMFSGVFEVHQNPNTSAYITGMKIDLAVNADNMVQEHNVQAGVLVTSFSLVDLSTGGNPAAITAFTPS